MAPSTRRLSTEILRWQVAILVGLLIVSILLALHAARGRLDREYQQRALAVANTIAATPEIVHAVDVEDRSGVVQRRAMAIRKATGVALIVIGDRRGIRMSHPDPREIGKPVATDPSAVLAGRTVLAVQRGSLGPSARARVPLRTADGRVVGLGTVSVLRARIHRELIAALPLFGLYASIALAFGLLASLLLARRLKRQTFGLELREIAGLLQEREATLRGIREGIVAVDPEGRLQILNGEAQRLLDLPEGAVGRPASELAPGGSRLGDLLTGKLSGEDLLLVHGERVLLASAMPVHRDGRDLGTVVTLRDRTEFEALARELDSSTDLADALRAQAHEFSNRLHTVSGLLQLGHHEEAVSFIKEITRSDSEFRQILGERVCDLRAASLLVAKGAVATERGVVLRLAADLELEGELTDAPVVLSVLGNLVDNALDAARDGDQRPPWVEVGLRAGSDGTLVMRISDSGPGVPEDLRERIFEPGYTTKPPPTVGGRGVGLSLVRRMLERRGGSIAVSTLPGGGAEFVAVLPEAVRSMLADELTVAP
jgi:two-component system CitB family sensor kinase